MPDYQGQLALMKANTNEKLTKGDKQQRNNEKPW